MRFADLKNDFVFRRIFAHHPRLTAALLNDLLDRQGQDRIAELTLLSPEQAPDILGAKLSIVDVKCRDRGGRTFVVEMQLLHVAGFLNRVVYNACKAYTAQLPQGGRYGALADVIALSLCDFVIWDDEERRAQQLPVVPLVSHWSLRERASGADDLHQVQYAFVELPKVALDTPLTTVAERWAWLFRVGAHEGEVPAEASPEQREVLALSNEATFSAPELEAYRKVGDEIEQARQLALDAEARGRAEGKAEGKIEGMAAGLCEAVLDLCDLLGIPLDDAQRARLASLDAAALHALRTHLKRTRAWP